MHPIHRSIAIVIAFLFTPSLHAQLRLSTLTEFQFGNLPDGEPSDLKTSYHQLSLDYALEGFQIGLRGEGFFSSEPNRNYGELLQRSASYRRAQCKPLSATFIPSSVADCWRTPLNCPASLPRNAARAAATR